MKPIVGKVDSFTRYMAKSTCPVRHNQNVPCVTNKFPVQYLLQVGETALSFELS